MWEIFENILCNIVNPTFSMNVKKIPRIVCEILLIPHNIVMELNYVIVGFYFYFLVLNTFIRQDFGVVKITSKSHPKGREYGGFSIVHETKDL